MGDSDSMFTLNVDCEPVDPVRLQYWRRHKTVFIRCVALSLWAGNFRWGSLGSRNNSGLEISLMNYLKCSILAHTNLITCTYQSWLIFRSEFHHQGNGGNGELRVLRPCKMLVIWLPVEDKTTGTLNFVELYRWAVFGCLCVHALKPEALMPFIVFCFGNNSSGADHSNTRPPLSFTSLLVA